MTLLEEDTTPASICLWD